VFEGDPAPPQIGTLFRTVSLVAKRSPISATAELFVLNYIAEMETQQADVEPSNVTDSLLRGNRPFCGPSRAICPLYVCVCSDDNSN